MFIFLGSPVTCYSISLIREGRQGSFRTPGGKERESRKEALLIFSDLSFFENNKTLNLSSLNKEEKDHFKNIKNNKRKKEFLGIREIIKVAQQIFKKENSKESFRLNYGVLGQPYLSSLNNKGYEISIAHTEGVAVALIFPTGEQLGVDIEYMNQRAGRTEAIASTLTPKEIEQLPFLATEIISPHYFLWSMKESLSKILKCGLTVPFQLLELCDLNCHNNILSGHYSNFEQYRTIAKVIEKNYVISLTLPRYTDLKIDKMVDPEKNSTITL